MLVYILSISIFFVKINPQFSAGGKKKLYFSKSIKNFNYDIIKVGLTAWNKNHRNEWSYEK